MNTTKKLLAFMALMAVVLVSCEKDEEPEPEVMPPSNVAATVVVSTDNSGDVTVTPTADGASRFDLYWGDATTAPTTVNPGSSATHTYEEGDYTLRVVAVGSTGLTAEITKPVNVTFAAPANLVVNAAVSETNLFEVTVTPTADNASMFDVDFGVEGADVQSILASESATYEYAEAGDYTITVTAKGAGAATSEATETVSITGPTGSIELPVDFEDASIAYEFTDFEGNVASVIDNPDTDGNESAKVGSILKSSGSAVFAGSIITLGSAIDFTQGNTIQMKAWSPKAGGTVKLKLEDSSDPPNGIEVDATTENASAWETLSFNFAAQINPDISYNKIIVFFDFGNTGDDTTYYFDDIELVEGASKERPQLPLGFENSDTEDYTWGVFGGVDPAEVIANPDTNGNTSANVTAITKNAGAEVYAGASLNLNGAIDWSAGTTVKIDVWSPRAGTPILLKLEDSSTNSGGGASTFAEVSVSSTQAGMWETLYFDMTGANGGFATTTTYDAVVVFPDFGTNGGGETFYFDNIEVTADNGGGGGNDVPTTAAPTPTQDAADVIAIYSDAYTPITVTEFPTEWSSSGYEEVQIAGNNTVKYAGLDFTGIVTDYGNPTDLTGMTHVHFDYWTADGEEIGLKLVNTVVSQEDIETRVTTKNEWVSVDIALDDFAFDRSQVTQILFDNIPAGNITLYMDNLYFYAEATGGDAPTTAAPTPTRDAADVISIYSDAYTPTTVTELPTEWSGSGFEAIQIEGNNTIKYFDLDFTGIVTDYGNPTDLSSMTHVHFDYWSPDGETIGLKLVNTTTDPAQEDIETTGVAQGQWVGVDIALDDFAFDRSAVTQILFDNMVAGTITLYMDNLYFYVDDNGGGGNTAPTTAAPTPTRDEANVISIYSDAYTPTTVTELPTEWSGSGFEEVQIEGNNTIKYFDLDFTGIVTDYGNPTDLTGMTHVHFDYWSADGETIGLKLVNTTTDPVQEDIEQTGVAQGQWIGVDIPLDDFAFDRSAVTQILFDNMVAGTITLYIDNLYFYNE